MPIQQIEPHELVQAASLLSSRSRPLRIAQIVNTLEIGGLERLVVDLTLALRGRGHVLQVLCLRQSGAFSKTLERAGVEVVAMHKSGGFSPGTLRRVAHYLRSRRIDVVHTHNPLVHHYGAIAGRLANVPVVISTRHGLGNFPLPGWHEAMTEMLYTLSCLITDHIVSVCEAARQYFEKHSYVASRKQSVIRNGIQLDRFAHIAPRTSNAEIVFGTVARLVPVKDHRTLLEAFALVVRENPRCRLRILGDGPLRQDLDSLSRKLELTEVVQFHGSSLEVQDFLAGLDVFVLSSVSEGMPLTVLEAMARGLPVVSTAVGGVPDLIQEARCGWLCPPLEPASLAAAMLAAAASGNRVEMGARAREYALASFSIDRMADDYERLFKKLLALSPGSRRIA